MRPFKFLTKTSFLNQTNYDLLVFNVDGVNESHRFLWGSENTNPDYFVLNRFTGTAHEFINTYASLVGVNNRLSNNFYHPPIPEIDIIMLPYVNGVLTFISNEDHSNLPNFHNWTINIDYRKYFRTH